MNLVKIFYLLEVNVLTLLRSGTPFGERLKLSIRVIVRAIINIVKMFTDE